MKRQLLFLVALLALSSMFCGFAHGETSEDNVVWTLSADSTLTISGTGTVRGDDEWYLKRFDIKRLVLGEGITEIGHWAFAYYYGLTSVTFPSTLTTIGERAFGFCYGITYITIPASVTYIGEAAFESCKKLTGFAIETGNTNYRSIDGVLFNAERTRLFTYPIGKQETSYTVPDEVRHIETAAFSECIGLTSIFLPDSLETIGYGAFNYNPNLTSLVIPNLVTSIGVTAFWNCKGISHIVIPESVTSIGYQAFDGCTGLKSITVSWQEPSLIEVGNQFYHMTQSEISQIRLYVPEGTVSKYRSINAWKDLDIKEGSANNHPVLSSLSVSKGSLYPTFSQTCTSYVVSVGNSVSSITLSATPYPLTATVSGDGEKALAAGENTFDITVTSESGESQTYTVKVFRLSGEYALTADGYINQTVRETFDVGEFNVIYGRYMYYILETFNVSGDLSFRFDFDNGITCDKTVAVQPNSRYKITLNLSTNPSDNGLITIITPYDAYGRPGTPYIEYPYHDYVLSISEGSNLVSASPITLHGTLTNVSASVVFDGSSGINYAGSSSLRVYPSPAAESVTISGLQGSETLYFYNISGNMLFARQATCETENIPVGHLPAGVYFVKTNNGQTLKWIKK
ncbi:MAG: leucine-rich repeat protein [Dysgonamonadaceae bacterium]|jgi:hypothetical protein|nr:leucine-rich repeat protein [Dysgonamonadaceae bacterium]